ncbi:MAG: type VI secretion system tip protein TssI/VgrG [Byssovorax sp.]
MENVRLSFEQGDTSFSVRRFRVEAALSSLFAIHVVARSPHDDLDLAAFVGKAAGLALTASGGLGLCERNFRGICVDMRMVRSEGAGLSTYEIQIAPTLWKLTQRTGNRLFQHVSIPDIVEKIFLEWGIEHRLEIARSEYPALELRAQYGESDFAFVSRLLEEAGISYSFEDLGERSSRLVLHDRPQERELRATGPLPFVDEMAQGLSGAEHFVTRVELHENVAPGRVTLRDHDFRRPTLSLFGERKDGKADELAYEQYVYRPGDALREIPRTELPSTAPSDDLGVGRHLEKHLTGHAQLRLAALRTPRKRVLFRASVADVSPGDNLQIMGHARTDLSTRGLLVTRFSLEGEIPSVDAFLFEGEAVFRDVEYRPALSTPKPVMHGAQSAVVVGPAGAEIHTDEFGRVRVQLRWDREGELDEHSSVWLRVSQGWAGSGYGMFALPRVGHEVLVSFFEGDPDSPYVSGRLHNAKENVPHKLPENQTVSTWKSCSSPYTGGFNEIRFDDAAGREMVYEQAERDRKRLVKNDEQCAVGGNRTRSVRRNESIGVGGSRTSTVALNELQTTGVTRTEVVGVNRQSFIGGEESTVVGSKFSVTVARGMTARLAKRLEGVLQGPLGAIFRGPAGALLGLVPATALGAFSGVTEEALNLLETHAPRSLLGLLGLEDGLALEDGPPPTTFEIRDRTIVLSTGEASITLKGPDILLHANRNIVLQAMEDCAVLAEGEAAIAAFKKVLVLSRNEDLIVQAAKDVHLNPFQLDQDPRPAHVEVEFHPKGDACDECGAVLVVDDATGGWMCQNLKKQRENVAIAEATLAQERA